jgi:hypothetical protein
MDLYFVSGLIKNTVEAANSVAGENAVYVMLGKRQFVTDTVMQSPIRPASAGSLVAVPRIGVTASTCKKCAEKKSNARRNEGSLYGLVANLLLDLAHILPHATSERVGKVFDLTAQFLDFGVTSVGRIVSVGLDVAHGFILHWVFLP